MLIDFSCTHEHLDNLDRTVSFVLCVDCQSDRYLDACGQQNLSRTSTEPSTKTDLIWSSISILQQIPRTSAEDTTLRHYAHNGKTCWISSMPLGGLQGLRRSHFHFLALSPSEHRDVLYQNGNLENTSKPLRLQRIDLHPEYVHICDTNLKLVLGCASPQQLWSIMILSFSHL